MSKTLNARIAYARNHAYKLSTHLTKPDITLEEMFNKMRLSYKTCYLVCTVVRKYPMETLGADAVLMKNREFRNNLDMFIDYVRNPEVIFEDEPKPITLDFPKKYVKLKPKDKDQIKLRMEHGDSAVKLAGQYGCSIPTIYYIKNKWRNND